MIEISTVSRRRLLTLAGFTAVLMASVGVATGVSQHRILAIEPMLASMLSRPHNPNTSSDKSSKDPVVFHHPHDPFAPGSTVLVRASSDSRVSAPGLARRFQQHQMIANRFPALLAQQADSHESFPQAAHDTTAFADSTTRRCQLPSGVKPDIENCAETDG